MLAPSPARVNIGPGQTVTPTLTIYRPSTINIALEDTGGAPYTGPGPAFVKLTSAYDGSTQTYAVPASGALPIDFLNGVNILPNVEYTAEAWATGTPLCSTPLTQRVPDDYPSVLSTTFTLTMGACPSGSVAVTVNWGTGFPAAGATVTLSGGPYLLNPVTGTTNAAGLTTFTNVPSGSGYTVTATRLSQTATPQVISVATGATTPVTMTLGAGLVVQVRWIGLAVNGATVRLTGPAAYDVTQTTPASGNVTFANVPPGAGYTLIATRLGQSTSTPLTIGGQTTTVTLNLPTTTLVVTVRQGTTLQINGTATVRLTLGPMGINVLGTTNASGQVTFLNVPRAAVAGSLYTIRAWNTPCTLAGFRSQNLTNRTVNTAPTTNINATYNSNTCP